MGRANVVAAGPAQLGMPAGMGDVGGNCVPNPSAGQVVPQRGACPSGYEAVGAYCLPPLRRGLVIPDTGMRPPKKPSPGR